MWTYAFIVLLVSDVLRDRDIFAVTWVGHVALGNFNTVFEVLGASLLLPVSNEGSSVVVILVHF
jgi:hypothetical protein